eukprot:1178884-Prorocentrum_minimum.AAC.1
MAIGGGGVWGWRQILPKEACDSNCCAAIMAGAQTCHTAAGTRVARPAGAHVAIPTGVHTRHTAAGTRVARPAGAH